MPKKIVALDIGGVVASIDKSSFNNFLTSHGLNETEFFDQDFLSLQRGSLKPEDFFKKKSEKKCVSATSLLHAFSAMVKINNAKQILQKISVPYLFLSKINQIHFEELVHHIIPSDFARQHSRLSYQVGYLKPHEIFFTSLHELEVSPNSIICIDDQLENLAVAKKFGLTTAHCPTPKSLPLVLRQCGVI